MKSTHPILKNHAAETQLFKRRSVALVLLSGLGCLLIIIRLFVLQINEHKRYQTLSTHNAVEILPIPAKRGRILDRHGAVLADNTPIINLALIPDQVPHLKASIEAIQTHLPLSSEAVSRFMRTRAQSHPFNTLILKPQLSAREQATFALNRYRFPGLFLYSTPVRHYTDPAFSHLVGYVGRLNDSEQHDPRFSSYRPGDMLGKTGLEKQYESMLRGQLGFEAVEVNVSGHRIRSLKTQASQPGKDLILTIDARLQRYIQHRLGHITGAVVAIDPRNGDVLALVSNPTFDANAFAEGISTRTLQQLIHHPNRPLFNRAINGQYAPGSIIKPFIALGALNEGTITPNTKIFDPGYFQLEGTTHRYHDWKTHGHGWVNLKQAITVSCDTFFYTLAPKLGIDAMARYLHYFGFGQKTGIDLPHESAGLVPTPHWKQRRQHASWYTGDTVLTAIGQGFLLATPLQMASATANLAATGHDYLPHVRKKQSVDNTPRLARNDKRISYYHAIQQDMQAVTQAPNGTTRYFRHLPYPVAGKTGTAEVFKNKAILQGRAVPNRLKNNHLFIAFAPANAPVIALSVVLEHTPGADLIARDIIDFYQKQVRLDSQHNE
jgi:penicillin-binding protein 2